MHRGTRDVITVRRSEPIAISLLDPDSAGYDEMVRQLDELERSAPVDLASSDDDEPLLRRVVAFRVGADPDESPMPALLRDVGRQAPA